MASSAKYIDEGKNPDAPGYFLQWLINKQNIHGVVYRSKWFDIGTIETYRKVFEAYLK